MDEKIKDLRAEVGRRFEGEQHIFLATDEKGQPRVRPVTLVNYDKKFWILTGANDAKVKQIRENPKMEFCLLFKEGEHSGYIRAIGLAKIISDRDAKAKVAKNCSFFSEHWKSPDDPKYALLELKLDEVEYIRPNEVTTRKFRLQP